MNLGMNLGRSPSVTSVKSKKILACDVIMTFPTHFDLLCDSTDCTGHRMAALTVCGFTKLSNLDF